MSDEVRASIIYDQKNGRIIVEGLDGDAVKEIAKAMSKRKKVMIQLLPEGGFIVSKDGVFLSKVHAEQQHSGYA